MKRLLWTPLLLTFAALPALAETAEELDNWFRDGYAALYAENAWDHGDEFAQYLAKEITYRGDDGQVAMNVNEFVVDSLDDWRDEGWLGTDVEQLDTRLLNESTALFDIKWRDRNDDGSTEITCGWYIADKSGEKWLLSQYIEIGCSG